MKLKILGFILFIAGLFLFATGLIFLDLASLSLKNDLYTLTVLGTFNNFFSLNPPLVIFQTVLSFVFIIIACLMVFASITLIKVK